MTFWLIVLASLAGGVLSVLLAATVLTVRPAVLDAALPRLISYSTGTLLGAAFLGMLPHASRELPASVVSPVVLIGILTFYVMEKLLVWRHCHKHDCHVHASSGPLLLIGDAVHNFVDGVVIAGAFLASTALGLTVALSTVAHEIPQEVGEFMIYLRGGWSRRRALWLNVSTSLTSVLGAVLGYYSLSWMRGAGPYLLAFAAAGFLYVALADLVPSQRGRSSILGATLDMLLVAAGIGTIGLLAHGHRGTR